jgi:hypothetical protein
MSGSLDDFADLDGVDCDRVTCRRVGPELLRRRPRRLLGFEDEHRGAGVLVKPDPVRAYEAWRLRYARYATGSASSGTYGTDKPHG